MIHAISSPARAGIAAVLLCASFGAHAAPLRIDGVPVELTARTAGDRCVRLTLTPLDRIGNPPENPALAIDGEADPVIRIRSLDGPRKAKAGELTVELTPSPLEMTVSRADGGVVQKLRVGDEGGIHFALDDKPVLGLGEGGPRPGKEWRKAPVEFDRRGRLHKMEPRWQSDAYGSRNPVALLVGTGGWGLYFASPWGRIDLRDPAQGHFLPIPWRDPAKMRQNHGNQREQLGKGLPPMEKHVRDYRDVFVFDAAEPRAFLKDVATISGAAALPPRWALGYMQSHRTLEDDKQMVEIVDTFRAKRIPLDAVIYLGTGFTPRGWNKQQPSFEFNPEVFRRDPREVVGEIHKRNAKVVLHMVPWDRDRIPLLDDSRLPSYWKEHEALVAAGVDGWWPDEGDWFDLHERFKRHQLYHQGPLSTRPDERPWSLHRNGHLGVARWGGWIWSGDTDSTWKSLEAQIAVGINHSLSLSPFWGSDIGGFFSTPELTGELYARWFQFGAFCPSFRSHGRTWWTRLPWGWGLDTLGPVEDPHPPDAEALNDPRIEEIARRYATLRYRLLSHNYRLAWEARETGLPMMRALWIHHPGDERAAATADQYLWGRDLLVAPVYQKGATRRSVYLPAGTWYDFWTGGTHQGPATIEREVDLMTMPLYARAGTVLPLDPPRQFTGEKTDAPLTIRIYQGASGSTVVHEDDGSGPAYLKGGTPRVHLAWDDESRSLTVTGDGFETPPRREFRVERVPAGDAKTIRWNGGPLTVGF